MDNRGSEAMTRGLQHLHLSEDISRYYTRDSEVVMSLSHSFEPSNLELKVTSFFCAWLSWKLAVKANL